MAKIRTLLIGCGKMGRNHLRVLRENPRFEVVGIVDVDAEVRHLAEGLKIPWRRQIPSDGYQAAIIATRAYQHFLANDVPGGIPTLVEKPLAETADTARALIRPKLVVGHIERFNPAVRALRALLEAKGLGPVLSASTERVGSPPATEADIVTDLAVHDIDICRWLFGPLRVEASMCEEKRANMELLSATSVNIEIAVDWTSPHKARSLTVTGLLGTATVDYMAQSLTVLGVAQKIERVEPLLAELNAFGDFVETGKRAPELCSAEDGAAAVQLCDHARTPRGFV